MALTPLTSGIETVAGESGTSSASRLSELANTPAYADAMTTEKLIAFAEERGIAIDTEESAGVRRLVFLPDPQHRWRILKLLDDDYLRSSLTELDYEVNSKSPMRQP